MDYIPEPSTGKVEIHLIDIHNYDPEYCDGVALSVLEDEHKRDHINALMTLEHTHDPEATVMSEIEQQDEIENNLLVAGGVLLALRGYPSLGEVKTVTDDDGRPTNQIIIHPEWMKSPYRITVERVKE